ncbi:Hypothetical predicted protein [Podarcis lilfordi]|uniref:Secreted protein n=1 Tax=Podarcis lilfordi TaxID=74358 RepID=A0AA35PBE8_9SAUR|nr:Hypothetical predicted protein [Podarcis lilfordi]
MAPSAAELLLFFVQPGVFQASPAALTPWFLTHASKDNPDRPSYQPRAAPTSPIALDSGQYISGMRPVFLFSKYDFRGVELSGPWLLHWPEGTCTTSLSW